MTPITTFEETLDQQGITELTCLQILSQAQPIEEADVELVKGANQLQTTKLTL